MPELKIMRGLPGAGKDTWLKNMIADIWLEDPSYEIVVCSADDFFMQGGKYKFVPWQIGQAHEMCKKKCFSAMKDGKNIAISNTNVRFWEYDLYIDMAEFFGYTVVVHSIFDGGCTNEELAERNLHGVPLEVIERMRNDYQ